MSALSLLMTRVVMVTRSVPVRDRLARQMLDASDGGGFTQPAHTV